MFYCSIPKVFANHVLNNQIKRIELYLIIYVAKLCILHILITMNLVTNHNINNLACNRKLANSCAIISNHINQTYFQNSHK